MILKEIARSYLTLQCVLPATNPPLFMAIFSTFSGEETATFLQAYQRAQASHSFPTLGVYKTMLLDFVEGCFTSPENQQAFASGMLDSLRNLHTLFATVEKGSGLAFFQERACKAVLARAMEIAHRVRARYPLPAASTVAAPPPFYTSADWAPPPGE